MYVLNVYNYMYDNLYTYVDISEIISDGSSLSGLNFISQKPRRREILHQGRAGSIAVVRASCEMFLLHAGSTATSGSQNLVEK